jgi:glycyl-tRNA synthetase
MSESSLDKLVSLCKRRGFIYPASELYGGIRGFWDYGPLGVLLKNNIRDWWWKCMVETPPIGPDGEPVQMVGLDSAIIQHPRTWEASGHVQNFNDPLVDCTQSKKRYRADHIQVARCLAERNGQRREIGWVSAVGQGDEATELIAAKAKKLVKKTGGGELILPEPGGLISYARLNREQQLLVIGPDVEVPGTLTEPRPFNMMMFSYNGPVHDEENKVYLRPETAQGIFTNFKNVLDTTRVRVPFGIAQVGKSFRNEVTPRNFVFRSREFEQMEMEFFCSPDESNQWLDFWVDQRMKWWLSLGIDPAKLRFQPTAKEDLAFYSRGGGDIEYVYPFTAPEFGELEGIAHRGDYDLTQHSKFAGQKLDYFDQELQLKLKEQGASEQDVKSKSRYIPHVIEPASGLTRAVLVLLCEAYRHQPGRAGTEEWFAFKPKFAPIKVGVFPLVNKDGMPETARRLYMNLRLRFTCEYDPKASIGKRYARMDEIGTPFCVTVDGQTASDGTVTLRTRDTMAQERIPMDQVESLIAQRLEE